MASVGAIYAVRKLAGPTALKLYVCAVSSYVLVQLVWVHKVFSNLEQVGVAGSGRFVESALVHAALPVQLTLGVLAVALAWFVADLIPRSSRRLQYR